MKIFLAIFVGMIIGFLLGYTACAIFCVNDISLKKNEDKRGTTNE